MSDSRPILRYSILMTFFLWFLVPLFWCDAAQAVSISGTVLGADTQSEFGTHVFLVGLQEKYSSSPSKTARIVQKDIQFHPRIAAVVVGDTLTVADSDLVTHNVRIVQDRRQIMNKLTFNGMTVSHRFDQPGMYRLQCNIHPAMRGRILVLPSPFLMQKVGPGGTFTFDLPDKVSGTINIRVWTDRGGFTSDRPIDLYQPQSTEGITLDIR